MENLGSSSSALALETSQLTTQAFGWTLAGHNRRCPCCSPRRNRWTSYLRIRSLNYLSQLSSWSTEDIFLNMDSTVAFFLDWYTIQQWFNTIIEILESYTKAQNYKSKMQILKQNMYGTEWRLWQLYCTVIIVFIALSVSPLISSVDVLFL